MRQPALAPAPLVQAIARQDNPQRLVQQHYETVWQTRMRDMPFVNPAVQVQALGFARHEGDWLGVVVTPWFINLFLLYGGGTLWQDLSAGQRRLVQLPCGQLQFLADNDPALGLYQYCPLVASMGSLSDHASALQVAQDALQAVLTAAPAPADELPAAVPPVSAGQDAGAASRRGFFRRLGGRA